MGTEYTIGIALGIYFVGFISYAIYKENKLHHGKPEFKNRKR